jgi:hypothetical protein
MFKTALKWRIIIHFAWRVIDDIRRRRKKIGRTVRKQETRLVATPGATGHG